MTELWRHQQEARDFASERRGSLLATCMGGGKSLTALTLLEEWGVKYGIVVCPKSVIPVWPAQVERHGFKFRVYPLVKGSTSDKARLFTNIYTNDAGPYLFIVNYDSVWRGDLGAAIKAATMIDCIVLDEIHRIKAPGSKVSWYFRSVGPYIPKKLGLSGTPLPNSPLDAYGSFRFLDPSVFGTSFARFRARYAIMGGYQGRQVLSYTREEEFRDKYNSVVITQTLDDIELSLPSVVHKRIEVVLPPKARRVYKKFEDDFIADVNSGVIVASNALVRMLRLSQLANGFSRVETAEETNVTEEFHNEKAIALKEFLEDLPLDEKVVVFCRFRYDLDQIRGAVEDAGRFSYELSGSKNELDLWDKRPQGAVLAVQIQAGSEGVDFTAARYCCYYSLDFSLGRYEQSLARVHRPGQTRPVIYTHFVAKDTIDQKLYAALTMKRKVIDAILADSTGEEPLDDLPF